MLKIIGWTDYSSDFPSATVANKDVNALLEIVVKEISANGYVFSGEEHQNADTGVPVFSDGTCFRASMRAWGCVMTAAYPKIDDREAHYMDFYMETPMPANLPKQTTIDVPPMKSDNFSGLIVSQDKEVLSESLSAGFPFFTTDKALNYIMDRIKENRNECEKKEDE